MDKLCLFLILFGCLATVLSTPGMYGGGMMDRGMMGGGMMDRGMMGGRMMAGGMMAGGMMGGGMMDDDEMYMGGRGGMVGRGYYGRRPRCRCRKYCRRWERYMGKCWKCRWWRCRVYCCRY